MKNTFKILAAGAILLSASGAARADISVNLNGQPLATSVSPLQVGGRTLVPMRDIFEALGAQLSWNPVAQTITAQKDLTTILLAINNPNARVNGRDVLLEQPATLVNGRTFVPLRFVAEATGAQVDWNAPLQLISIRAGATAPQNPAIPVNNFPNPLPADALGGTQVANARTISIPNGAVIPVQIDTALSSATARVGQTFTATVISRRLGDSEFPSGTKIEGRIIEARPSENNQPGVLDINWIGAVLPDGSRVPLRGQLTSLDTSNVQMTGGRIVASGAKKDNKLKVIGIGAGAGFVLGRVLGTNSTVTTILGAAGGYLLGKSRDRKAQEATITAQTTLGVRLDRAVRYADVDNYADYRERFLRVANDTSDRYDPNYYGFDEASAVPRGANYRDEEDDRYADYDYADRLPSPAPVDAPPLGVGDIYREDEADFDPRFPDNRVPDTRFPDTRRPNNRIPARNDREVAGYQQISIPGGAVVPVTLDQDLSSATARVGQSFSATVVSQQLGDSEFPAGSKLEGRVIEARPQQGEEPGTLDLEFRTAILPDGTRIPLSGNLISLDENAVQTQNGRIVAKAGNKKTDRLKVIGIGAAAGFVLGRVLKKDGILPSLLGALGGYLYGAKQGDKPAEARVAQGTRLGVRLTDDVRYNDSTQYYTYRARYLRQS
ncbi:MAG TPA: copper amine oxidase N-terminal domain-containing protein [Abditibacterium sp.]|jgi:hypothetical protein